MLVNMDIIGKCNVSVLEAITNRRSIRKYTDEPVTSQQIDTLLNAAFCAPSAHNRRPWEFVVVQDKDKLLSFAEYATYQKMLVEAKAAIVICGDQSRTQTHDLLVNDCSAATQNILLAAYGLGLGAVWCGIVQEDMIEFFRNSLNMTKNILPVALVALGHPAEEKPATPRFDGQHVHYERFNDKD